MNGTPSSVLHQLYVRKLTPLLSSRLTPTPMQNGTKKLRNFRMLSQGGIRRRGGFRYLQTLTNTAYSLKLISMMKMKLTYSCFPIQS